jgi:hypothetical protein
VTGGNGPVVSVTQQVYYSRTPPTTTRTVRVMWAHALNGCPARSGSSPAAVSRRIR